MNTKLEKYIGILSIIPLIFSIVLGFLKEQNTSIKLIQEFIPNSKNILHYTDNIYKVIAENNLPLYISFASHVGYSGPMQLAIIANQEKKIDTVVLIKSPDTKPYLDKILENKLPNHFLNQSITNIIPPDAVSGATISSNAIIHAVEKASHNLITNNTVQQELAIPQQHNQNIKQNAIFSSSELYKLGIVLFLFLSAFWISTKNFKYNKLKSHYILAGLSFVSVGILFSMQFSLSTITLLLSGIWKNGIASYAPLFALILAILCVVFTKKNLYCSHICPFGTLQEGISLITHCSMPPKNNFIKWITRFFTLLILCFAIYYAIPSYATYEPFGKTFNMIGSFTLFVLSIAVILSSLIFKKPWCHLLCPMTPFFDYILFWRKLLTPSKKIKE